MSFKIENGVLVKYREEVGGAVIAIPDSVTSIGNEAFNGCKGFNLTIKKNIDKLTDCTDQKTERL